MESVWAGDTLIVRVVVEDELGQALVLSDCTFAYVLYDRNANREVLRKTSAEGITLDGSTVVITIPAGQTATLRGVYYHELEATDAMGQVFTLLGDDVRFVRTEIAP